MVYGKRIGAIEFRHLRYFIATAEAGSVTKAADKIGIQQPPLSQQLRALETAIGAALFKRSSRGVELTKAGEHLFKSAKEIIQLTDRAVESTRQIAVGKQGSLRVGYTASTAFHRFVPDTLGAFRHAHPDVVLHLHECCTAELIEALHAGEVDSAFVRSPIKQANGLVVERLVEEPILVATPAAHPLAKRTHRGGICLAELADETLLLYRRKPGPGLYEIIIESCCRAGFAPRIGQEAPRMIGALNLVASGFGISLVPASMQEINTGAIRYLPLKKGEALNAPIQLAYRLNAVSPVARLFVQHVHAQSNERSAARDRCALTPELRS